jgi:curved DNA-binding protein CbpA
MTAVLEASIVPSLVPCDQKTLPLGRVEAFVLSQIDGRSSVDELASLAALSVGEVARIVLLLHELGAVQVPGRRSAPPKRPSAARHRRNSSRRLDLSGIVFTAASVPQLVRTRTSTPMGLGAKEGFLLSQIDGATSVSDLAAITGFELGPLTDMLGKLARAGTIEVNDSHTPHRRNSARNARVSAPPRASAASRVSMSPKASAASRVSTPPKASSRVSMPPKASAASRVSTPPKATAGPRVSTPPRASTASRASKAPPKDRGLAASDPTCELDDETRARVDELYGRLATANLYEMLGVGRDADKKAVKGAFFAFAATLHPDRHFRKKLGPYKQKINDVFVRLTLAYETLGTAAKRAEYDTKLPPLAPSSQVEAHKPAGGPAPRTSIRPPRRSLAPNGAPAAGPAAGRASRRPRPLSIVPTGIPVADRRGALASRLAEFRPPAPQPEGSRPQAALRQFWGKHVEKTEQASRQRAQVFVKAAEEALAKGDPVSAATHYKLALECCDAPDLRAAFDAVDEKARARRFEINVPLAEKAEREQRWEDAVTRYAKAYAARPEGRIAERLSNAIRMQGGDPRRAVKHAEEAVLTAPLNLTYRLTLGEAYADAGMGARARAEAERALGIAPKDPRAKALMARVAKAKG